MMRPSPQGHAVACIGIFRVHWKDRVLHLRKVALPSSGEWEVRG